MIEECFKPVAPVARMATKEKKKARSKARQVSPMGMSY